MIKEGFGNAVFGFFKNVTTIVSDATILHVVEGYSTGVPHIYRESVPGLSTNMRNTCINSGSCMPISIALKLTAEVFLA